MCLTKLRRNSDGLRARISYAASTVNFRFGNRKVPRAVSAISISNIKEQSIGKSRESKPLRAARILCGLLLTAPAAASDVFLMGDHVGYGVTRAQGESCFAIAPAWVGSREAKLFAMRPGVFRLPATVKRVFDDGFSIIRIGDDASLCSSQEWSDGANLQTALGRTRIGSLEIGVHDSTAGRMHVHVEQTDSSGFFTIAPVRESDKLMSGMSGSRVLLEDSAAGVLLEVDEETNRGRVIRQDYLTRLIAPFFNAWVEEIKTEPARVAETGPTIKYRFFIGKQTWRNNPKIVGTRLFVGSSGRTRSEPDVLDGVYSFDLETGEMVWHVTTDLDFNDLTYIKGLVIGGTQSGEVVAVGARSGKTYWSRKFDAPVSAQPAALNGAVAIATSAGELSVLDLKDGATRVSSTLDGGVSGGLAAGRGELWVATEAGTLHRYTGFGEVQMRRDSSVYYPDELGNALSGSAIDWYDRLGNGKGLRAKFFAIPLVLEDRIVLSLVREAHYAYPPVIAFKKDGELGWIGTDPNQFVRNSFGDSYLTPAPWYDRLILADPYSNSIYSISRETGEILWATEFANPNFQMWSSPVVARDHVYIATYDGFLHKFSAGNGERVWSIYLGQHQLAGRTFFRDEPLPDVQSSPEFRSVQSSPVFSTPAISDHTIVVGTDEGFLYVIEDPQ